MDFGLNFGLIGYFYVIYLRMSNILVWDDLMEKKESLQ